VLKLEIKLHIYNNVLKRFWFLILEDFFEDNIFLHGEKYLNFHNNLLFALRYFLM